MFELKSVSEEAISRSLQKAERYRLLNEPAEAESICLDILQIDPENQEALVNLLLALTDQFEGRLGATVPRAQELIPRIHSEYERDYYTGIICERRAKARLHAGLGAEPAAYDWLRQAMEWYEKAEAICPVGNNDATLRWNTCARLIMGNPRLRPAADERVELPLE